MCLILRRWDAWIQRDAPKILNFLFSKSEHLRVGQFTKEKLNYRNIRIFNNHQTGRYDTILGGELWGLRRSPNLRSFSDLHLTNETEEVMRSLRKIEFQFTYIRSGHDKEIFYHLLFY
jgi:hypothetical protein